MDNPSWRMNFSLPIWAPLLILNMETGPGVRFAVEQVIYHSLEQPTKFLGIPQRGFSHAVGYIFFLFQSLASVSKCGIPHNGRCRIIC